MADEAARARQAADILEHLTIREGHEDIGMQLVQQLAAYRVDADIWLFQTYQGCTCGYRSLPEDKCKECGSGAQAHERPHPHKRGQQCKMFVLKT